MFAPQKNPAHQRPTLPARLSDHVWRLGGHHIACFLVKGADSAALVEVGISASVGPVLGQLAATGTEPRDISCLLLSHAHSDHATGQAGFLAGLPNALLHLSPSSARHLSKAATLRQFAEEDIYTGRYMHRLDDAPEPASWPKVEPLLPAAQRMKHITAGDTLDLGGVSLTLLPGEGHAPGGLAVWVPEDGVLLASDSAGFVQQGAPGFPLYFVSYPTYQEELRAMAALSPQVAAPAHQEWFSGPAAGRYLEETAGGLAEMHAEIIARLENGESGEAVSMDIFARFYCDELIIYPADSIKICCDLLVERSRQAGPAA